MKSSGRCAALLVLAWLSAGHYAIAQTNPYSAPSVLPFPATPTILPAGYRTVSASNSGDFGPTLASTTTDVANAPQPPALPGDAPAPPSAGGAQYGTLGTDTPMFPSTPTTGCASGQCGGGGGNSCMSCVPCCNGATWFGSIGGLAMTRNDANAFWTTYQTNVNVNQLMQTKEAGGNWGGGGQVTFGRWWCCCNQGIGLQFVYWQLFGMGGYSSYSSASNNLSTPIDLQSVNITSGAGTFAAGHFFDNSPEHRIWRQDQVLNLELNLLHQQIYASPGVCTLTALAGFRYFRFQESLTFGSVAFGDTFGSNGGANEAYLSSQVTNNLYGAQIGMLANFNFAPAWGAYILPKVGVYGNSMTARNQLYTGDGFSNMDIHSSKTALSMLAEVDLGTYYWLSQNCQLFVGWRVVAVSQVALGDNQFLPYLADTAGYGLIKSNGDLILTGGFAGLAFTF